MTGGKQQIALEASPTHDLFKAALNNCSEKLLASEMEWSYCLNFTVSFSHSVLENFGMSGTLLRVVYGTPGTAGQPA